MNGHLHLSRVRLRASRGEALSAIAPLLIPADKNRRVGHAHHIVWLLFQDILEATRDFLWRDEGNGRYFILSHRPPVDPFGLFDVQTKPFEPELAAGDRLSFVLRANPVTASKGALDENQRVGRVRGKRVDVVMHALFSAHSKEERNRLKKNGELAALRDKIATESGEQWLAHQGDKAGFRLADVPAIDVYAQVPIERGRGRKAGFSTLDLSGDIMVTDPKIFLEKLAKGFGSAKAFGNGLMLIRRA